MKNFKKIYIHLICFSFFVLPVLSFAQTGQIPNPVKGSSNLMELIVTILNNVIMPVAAVAVVVWIIWAGFKFVLAQGNSKDIQDAKNNLLWALIGAGVLLGASGIATVVKNTIQSVTDVGL